MPVMVSQDTLVDTVLAFRDSMNTDLGGAAIIEFWEGSLPASCAAGEGGGDTLLATLNLSSTPWGAPSTNVFQLNAVTPSTVVADGIVGYWRIKDASDNCIMQGAAAASSSDINFNTDTWTNGDDIALDALIISCAIIGGVP